jgi:hypothetical protein
MTGQDFPSLREARVKPHHFDAAVAKLDEGIRAGSIRKVEFDDAKSTLSSAIYNGWSECVRRRFFNAGAYRSLPRDVQDLDFSISMHGVSSIIPTSKKLAKTKVTGPVVDAMRAFVAEVMPLALAVESLKDKIVKGRKPSTGPSKPVNPDKIVGTCGVCQRAIAVGPDGKMVHHGYERPGYGYQTDSCNGIRFRPLEVSPEGLEWVIEVTTAQEANLANALETRDVLTELHDYNTPRGVPPKRVLKGDPGWDRLYRQTISKWELDLVLLRYGLERDRAQLAVWVPKPLRPLGAL